MFQSVIKRGQVAARAEIGDDLDKAFLHACIIGETAAAITLLHLGANPNVENGHALYASATDGNDNIVRELIYYGVTKDNKTWMLAKEAAKKLGYENVVACMS